VHVLHPPVDRGSAAPLRLTRRGVAVVTTAVLLLAAVIVWLAAASAPRPFGAGTATRVAVVTVHPGDTLWSIAQRVAPNVDPRAEVAVLQRVNRLSSVLLTPGQLIRVG
jgi:nucleoid-associated protein YgaU